MKTKLTSLAAISALLFSVSVLADSLPSDAEMIQQGRASMNKHGDLNALFNQAQKNIAIPSQKIDVPSLSLPDERQSALQKDLSKDLFNTNLKSEAAKKAATKSGSDLIIFVSFSMPDDLLASYSAQAKASGATIVLRGMYKNSIAKTQLRALAVNKSIAPWEINPGLFRKFNIKQVPAIVLADSIDSQVIENGCAKPSAYLGVNGDVSIRQALLLMRSRGNGLLAKDAGKRLEKLEKE